MSGRSSSGYQWSHPSQADADQLYASTTPPPSTYPLPTQMSGGPGSWPPSQAGMGMYARVNLSTLGQQGPVPRAPRSAPGLTSMLPPAGGQPPHVTARSPQGRSSAYSGGYMPGYAAPGVAPRSFGSSFAATQDMPVVSPTNSQVSHRLPQALPSASHGATSAQPDGSGPNQYVLCQKCNGWYNFSDEERHERLNCDPRFRQPDTMHECPHCTDIYPASSLQSHVGRCQGHPVRLNNIDYGLVEDWSGGHSSDVDARQLGSSSRPY